MGKKSLSFKNKGFTLIEILIAISILSVVLSLVYGAYRATFFNSAGLEDSVATARQARIILDRFTKDIESMFTTDDKSLIGVETEIAGMRADTISFSSAANITFQPDTFPSEITNITYSVQKNQHDRLLSLYRHDSPDIPGNFTEDNNSGLLVSKTIEMFKITYFDLDGVKSSDWMSSQQQPELYYPEESKELVLPSLIMIEIRIGTSSENSNSTYFKTSVAIPPGVKKAI